MDDSKFSGSHITSYRCCIKQIRNHSYSLSHNFQQLSILHWHRWKYTHTHRHLERFKTVAFSFSMNSFVHQFSRETLCMHLILDSYVLRRWRDWQNRHIFTHINVCNWKWLISFRSAEVRNYNLTWKIITSFQSKITI